MYSGEARETSTWGGDGLPMSHVRATPMSKPTAGRTHSMAIHPEKLNHSPCPCTNRRYRPFTLRRTSSTILGPQESDCIRNFQSAVSRRVSPRCEPRRLSGLSTTRNAARRGSSSRRSAGTSPVNSSNPFARGRHVLLSRVRCFQCGSSALTDHDCSRLARTPLHGCG